MEGAPLAMSGGTTPEPRRLDDFGASPAAMSRRWAVFSDRVMGGVSVAHGAMTTVHGRRALQLTGTVSLERNGGFIQVACALGDPPGSGIDARAYRGLLGCLGSSIMLLEGLNTGSQRLLLL